MHIVGGIGVLELRCDALALRISVALPDREPRLLLARYIQKLDELLDVVDRIELRLSNESHSGKPP